MSRPTLQNEYTVIYDHHAYSATQTRSAGVAADEVRHNILAVRHSGHGLQLCMGMILYDSPAAGSPLLMDTPYA